MLFLFSLAAFLTGFLLLSIQFSFSKELLPYFGGAPNVWLASLAFYQTMLSISYLYSHFLQKHFVFNKQIIIHLTIILMAVILLPVSLNKALMSEMNLSGSLSLFAILLTSIGLPFFCLASSSPLIQSWFGKADHKKSENPYFLYISSNLGTFGALAAFPFFIEMNLNNLEQLKSWSFLFFINFILIIGCAFAIRFNKTKKQLINDTHKKELLTKNKIVKIIFYAFIPSAMLSTVTNEITLDISSMPLLWAIPLGLYFISFSFAFSEQYKAGLKLKCLAVGLIGLNFLSDFHIYIDFIIILSLLFLSAFIFHKEIYKLSPDKSELTIFYFLLSVGGALGGIFVGVICPLIFNEFYEHSIILALALFFIFHEEIKYEKKHYLYQVALIIPFIIIPLFINATDDNKKEILYKDRTFFGAYKIIKDENSKGTYHYLMHGSTKHGMQYIDTEVLRKTMTTYYSEKSPITKAINHYKDKHGVKDVALVGLGIGTLSCVFDEKTNVDFFEIDEAVLDIAQSQYFSYLTECNNNKSFVIGDARIKINEEKNNKYDIIVLDAFSSDSIPTHLLTVEFIKILKQKIKKDGLLIFHISNRHLNLSPILSAIAEKTGLSSVDCINNTTNDFSSPTRAVALGENVNVLTNNSDDCWEKTKHNKETPLWTDDYNSIFEIMIE